MKSLTKQEMRNIIDGKRTNERIPNLCSFWINPTPFGNDEEKMKAWLQEKTYDIDVIRPRMPGMNQGPADAPDYCWLPAGAVVENASGALDQHVGIPDWEDEAFIEKFYAEFPSPEYGQMLSGLEADDEKYVVCRWVYCLFERHWSLRGMENALTDFYIYPEEVHRLYQRLTDFYIRMMERACREKKVDAFFISDDIGTQTGPFFSPEIFRTFFKPYYQQMIDKAHEMGAHFWMHSCGNIEAFLEDLIEIGLDVIHPIQKYTMDEKKIAENYGGKICILAGFDVQQTIPYGSEEDVRKEARFMIDTYFRKEGKFMMTMGNGATADWKISCLDALYDAIDHAELPE